MTIEEALARVERDAGSHMTMEPDGEADLARVEERLGGELPAPFRAFLARFGGGIFYQRLEVFGSRRTMIHDIELVPDLLTVRERARVEGAIAAGDDLVPVCRSEGTLYLMDLADRPGRGRVLGASGKGYDDFLALLLEVVSDARARAAGAKTSGSLGAHGDASP